MSDVLSPTSVDHARRIEELGRIILAYSEVTEKLQQSHEKLKQKVTSLKTELGEKNRLLERSNRLAALGEMAAGLAHEIRNPLGGIQLYASMLSRDLASQPQSLALVQKIAGGVRRLETLVSQVLQFSREMRAQMRQMDLHEVVLSAVDLASQQCAARQARCRISGPASMVVRGDPVLLGQAVLNLVLNAAEAMQEPGTIDITMASVSSGDEESMSRQFSLCVHDSGPGIPPALLDRIFNPFFTTKDAGTGLGLAIVHRIVEAHDGTITAANAPGGGARFEIRI